MPRRRLLASIICILLLALPHPGLAQNEPDLEIASSTYIVIDADTQAIYAQRGADDRVAIASLTKIFTAVQAIEMAPLDMMLTTSSFDLRPADATVMGFGPGEQYTLEDLLYGMMLPSGNDAAYTIARTLGHQPGLTDQQSVDRFVGLMNQRVANMGLTNTHFVNPDGWGVPNHYSSAADVAAFMDYAMEYPLLVKIMGSLQYTTSNGTLTIGNTNKSLTTNDAVIAGKTGLDNDSGYCLVNVSEVNGTRMIAVTLDGISIDDGYPDWYADNSALLAYGTSRKAELANGGAFAGETDSWVHPDAAQLTQAGARQATVFGDHPVVPPAVPDPEPASTGRVALGTLGSIVITAGLVATMVSLRGASLWLQGVGGSVPWASTTVDGALPLLDTGASTSDTSEQVKTSDEQDTSADDASQRSRNMVEAGRRHDGEAPPVSWR